MTLTRSNFLRTAAAMFVAANFDPLSGLAQSATSIDQQCDNPEGLIAIDGPADHGLGDLGLLIVWQLSRAPVVANLMTLAPNDPFAAAREKANAVTTNWGTPSNFWNQLATAMVCHATSNIQTHELNGIADGTKSLAAVRSLLDSSAGFQEVAILYGLWASNTWTSTCGLKMNAYLDNTETISATATVATSQDFLTTLDLKAASDPAGALREAALLLYKLQLADTRSGSPGWRNKVASVWGTRPPASPTYLAANSSWPDVNFLHALFFDSNPLLLACQSLAGIDRSDIQPGGFCRFPTLAVWHAEALAAFVNGPGATAGFSTGANYGKVDVTLGGRTC